MIQQAALRAGLRLVPVNWHLAADDVAYVVADSGARVLFAESSFVDPGLRDPELWVSVDELAEFEATAPGCSR